MDLKDGESQFKYKKVQLEAIVGAVRRGYFGHIPTTRHLRQLAAAVAVAQLLCIHSSSTFHDCSLLLIVADFEHDKLPTIMAQQQSPMISIPKKTTEEVDWTTPIRNLIGQSYGESPDNYSAECAALQRCRQDAVRGAGSDMTGELLLLLKEINED